MNCLDADAKISAFLNWIFIILRFWQCAQFCHKFCTAYITNFPFKSQRSLWIFPTANRKVTEDFLNKKLSDEKFKNESEFFFCDNSILVDVFLELEQGEESSMQKMVRDMIYWKAQSATVIRVKTEKYFFFLAWRAIKCIDSNLNVKPILQRREREKKIERKSHWIRRIIFNSIFHIIDQFPIPQTDENMPTMRDKK